MEILKDEAEVSTWDMIVIPGDLIDRLLQLNDSDNVSQILRFLSGLLRVAEKYDIVVRILHGTPGHDHRQSDLIYDVFNIMQSKVDVKHITDLSIEYIERFNIHMLYVPDEWHHDVMETYDQTLKLLQQRNLTQVDFCLFHGAFNYQINEKLNPKAHPEELWSVLVKYYIFAGHVHYRSQYKNILVGGSFDRLAHGEEEPKGWVTCTIVSEDNHDIRFHENKHAMIYKTIDVRGMSTDEVLATVKEVVSQVPDFSHIRLWTNNRNEINDGLNTLRQQYSFIYFTIKVDEQKKKQEKTLTLVERKFTPIELNRESITRLVTERLSSLPNVNVEQVLGQLTKYM